MCRTKQETKYLGKKTRDPKSHLKSRRGVKGCTKSKLDKSSIHRHMREEKLSDEKRPEENKPSNAGKGDVLSLRGRGISVDATGADLRERQRALNSSEPDFVFVESHFAEPSETSGVRRGRTADGGKTAPVASVGQSSMVRRFVEATAEEIKMMVLPELVATNLQEGRVIEEWRQHASAGCDSEMCDSCEEAEQQLSDVSRMKMKHYNQCTIS